MPCETWDREARYWLAGMGGKWLLLVLLLLKPPRLDMLATDAPPGVAGGVAAHTLQHLALSSAAAGNSANIQASPTRVATQVEIGLHLSGFKTGCLPPGVAKGVPAGVVAAEKVGLNSLAPGLKEKAFALGFSFEEVGFGGCPLLAGLALAANHRPQTQASIRCRRLYRGPDRSGHTAATAP